MISEDHSSGATGFNSRWGSGANYARGRRRTISGSICREIPEPVAKNREKWANLLTDEQGEQFQRAFNAVLANILQVIKGKQDEVALVLVGVFAEGHILLEDVPGTGKTSLAKAIASSVEGDWSRIQFTPDLLPADVTGGMIFNQANAEFVIHKGPIFSNVVLADEINRASPKTQAALLEVMEERQVTIGNETTAVPRPFVVIATQNPVEQEGTYRLPEAQLDRFMMRSTLGYPHHDNEVEILDSVLEGVSAESLQPVATTEQVAAMIRLAQAVHVAPAIRSYIVRLVAHTRKLPELRLGVSPRGAIAMMRAAQALAIARGRIYVNVEDVKLLAPPVMSHRMLLTPEAALRKVEIPALIDSALDAVEAPAPVRSGS